MTEHVDSMSTDSAWGGLALTGVPAEPFAVMPAQQMRGIVKLGPFAAMTVTLRDEAAERRRLERAIDLLKNRLRQAGQHVSSETVEWHEYDERELDDLRPTAVYIVVLQNSSRDMRRKVLLDLLAFVADQDDRAVRERLAVRVR
jgi:hypothetical protein